MSARVIAVGIILLSSSAFSQEKKELKFPETSQIEMLLNQGERAFGFYGATVKQEQMELGKDEGNAKDQAVYEISLELIKKLKREPNLFNSPWGFLLVTDLDDAAHNMAVCSSQGALAGMNLAMRSNFKDANNKLMLSNSCMETSGLLYTVSENAADLYRQYLLANAVTQNKLVEAANSCADALHKVNGR